MVGHGDDLQALFPAALPPPVEQLAEGAVAGADAGVGLGAVDAAVMVGRVGIGEPEDGRARVPFGRDRLPVGARDPIDAALVRHGARRWRADPARQPGEFIGRRRALRPVGGDVDLPVPGGGVVQQAVAAGRAATDHRQGAPRTGQDLAQGFGMQQLAVQRRVGRAQGGEVGGGDEAAGKARLDELVGDDAVARRVAPGDQARLVDPGFGREHGAAVGEVDAGGPQAGEIGHPLGRRHVGSQPVEGHDQDSPLAMHRRSSRHPAVA